MNRVDQPRQQQAQADGYLRSSRTPNYPGILMLGLLASFVAAFSWYSWREQRVAAIAELKTVMEIGTRAVDIYFGQIEMSLQTLAQELEASREMTELHIPLPRERAWSVVKRFKELHTDIVNVSVVRTDGKILISASEFPGAALGSIADKDSFSTYRLNPHRGVDIGRPYLDPAMKQWIVPVRLGVRSESDELRYVVTAHLPIGFIATFWKDAPIVDHVAFGLIRDDGHLLGRYPFLGQDDYARVFELSRDGPLITHLRAQGFPISGWLEGKISIGQSLFAFHRLPHYPLTLFSVMPLSRVWAAWWMKVQVPYFLSAMMFLGGMFVYLIAKGRQRTYEASLQQAVLDAEQASRKLDAALNNMSHGLCMFDSDRRLILCNARYFEMYNLSPDEVKLGCTVEELAKYLRKAGIVFNRYDKNIAQIMESLATGNISRTFRNLNDGRTILITNRPLPYGGWVATHEDITAQLRHEASLDEARLAAEQASIKLDIAVNNMTHGLSMFDADDRLVVINSQYLQMYGMSPGVVKPGCTLLELFEHRSAIGSLNEDPKEYRDELKAQIAEGRIIKRVVRGSDGRELSIVNRPMPGGGFVAIHEDVTERKLAERNLEETQRFLNTIIEHAPVPIAVKDPASRKYILVNRAYEQLMGEDGDKVIGRTVHEYLTPDHARIIDQRDEEAIRSLHTISQSEVWLDTPGNGRRAVNTMRLVVRDNDDRPQHLISVIEDITERKRSEARIAHMAHHDALTDLPNRVMLQERLNEALQGVAHGEIFAVFYLDLDRFKSINDTLGHVIGDKLLRTVADRLRGCVRETDTIARLGGDEFAIIQTRLDEPADAAILARRIRNAVTAPCEIDGHHFMADVSIGISIAPIDADNLDQLLKNADMALYRAKADGRGTFRFFEAEMDARAKARHALEMDLRNALANNEFELYYQPLVNLERGEVVGCEALLRWNHPVRGMIAPTEFVPIAEETGLIIPIGDWALKNACIEAAKWPDAIKIAVNISPVQFKNPTLALAVINALVVSDLAPQRLELEITETILMNNNEATVASLHQLRDLGVKIALDDFGTGFSSLSYLRSFPFDKIKIDRTFIHDLSGPDGATAIVHAVVSLALSLQMTTTAEGVETQAQLDAVRELGCNEMQGYLFSDPVPATQIQQFFSAAAVRSGNVA